MSRSARGALWFAAACVALSASVAGAQTVRYVDDSAPVGGDGTSWATAFNSLHAGLAGAGPGVEVRVAQGTYAPAAAGGARTATFLALSGVTLRGGYAGIGAADPDQRDPAVYVTTLTGDLNGDDTAALGNRGDNSHHILTASGTAVVDGFLITAGNADSASNRFGGGLFVPGGTPTIVGCTFYRNQANEVSGAGAAIGSFSSQTVTVVNCAFIENSAKFTSNTVDGKGGAIFADALSLTDCTFVGNRANQGGAIYTSVACGMTRCKFDANLGSIGGAVYFGGTFGAVFTLTDCSFTGNSAGQSGAVEIFNTFSSTQLTGCTFTGNSTVTFGGAVNGLAGGMSATRCVFSGNSAGMGGGALTTSAGTALVTNCTVAHNTSSGATGGILLSASNSTPSVRNCILWGNTDASGETEAAQIARFFTTGTFPSVNYCDVKGYATLGGVGNIDADPLFADALAADFSLEFGSPCIDAGDPSPAFNDPDGSRNDMGAIRVQNAKPVADAVVTQLTAIGDSAMIRLDATSSSDPDGTTAGLMVEWLVDGFSVSTGTFAACGVLEIPVAFGTHTVELIVTDPGNAADSDTESITVSAASLALLTPTVTRVDFGSGEFRIQGEIALPSTVSSLELDPMIGATVYVGGVAAAGSVALPFQVGGHDGTAWAFTGPSGGGLIDRFTVEWGGSRLRFRDGPFPVTLQADTITSSESILQMSYKSKKTHAFTLTIGTAVINVSAAGTVTANVPVTVIDAGKEVALTLPFAITPATAFVFTGGVNETVPAADYLTITTGTFRVEGRIDTSLFPNGSATSPRSVDLGLLVGSQGYPGTAGVSGGNLSVRHDTWVAR